MVDPSGRVAAMARWREQTGARVLAQILLGVQRQLQQAFQQLIRRNADEVLEHELLGEQPADVTELQHPAARRVDEIAMAVVDHHEIALRVEPRSPQFPRRLVEGVTRKALVGGIAAARLRQQRGGDGDLRFGPADHLTLRDGDLDAGEPGFGRRPERGHLPAGVI